MDHEEDGQRELLQFLVKDYELKISYLTAHFSRMWIRFNYFLSIETALVGGKFVFSTHAQLTSGLAVVGLVVAIIWYVMGAEDRYLVQLYRGHVGDAGKLVGERIRLLPGGDYTWVGHVPERMPKGPWDPTSWRHKWISTTRMAAWIPLFLALAWIGVLAVVA